MSWCCYCEKEVGARHRFPVLVHGEADQPNYGARRAGAALAVAALRDEMDEANQAFALVEFVDEREKMAAKAAHPFDDMQARRFDLRAALLDRCRAAGLLQEE